MTKQAQSWALGNAAQLAESSPNTFLRRSPEEAREESGCGCHIQFRRDGGTVPGLTYGDHIEFSDF